MSELERDYAAAGFGDRMGYGSKPALLLIDVALAYIEPEAPLYVGSETAFQAMLRLATAARRAQAPLVFTRVEYMPGGADGGHFYRKVKALSLFQNGSRLADFDPRLKPQPGDIVITKQYASAFFGTSLAATLHVLGVDTCLLAGFSTSGCVRASTVDALQYGFRPIVVADACGDRDTNVQHANLFDLAQKYADVVTVENAEHYLSTL